MIIKQQQKIYAVIYILLWRGFKKDFFAIFKYVQNQLRLPFFKSPPLTVFYCYKNIIKYLLTFCCIWSLNIDLAL